MPSLTVDGITERCSSTDPAWGRTVVVGHDGSAAGRALVAHAARQAGPGGYVIVVHALPLGMSLDDAEHGGDYPSLISSLLESVDASFREGPPYETRLVVGPASKALLDAAERYEADEIVLGAAANRRARGAIGRVADAVLRHANCPVTIVAPARSRHGTSAR
jgi:nucleotide-binding universal stress UspA family protein